ncbi:MAG: hypothetical protein ACRD2U_07945, partial [Terriglobales bacterium]
STALGLANVTDEHRSPLREYEISPDTIATNSHPSKIATDGAASVAVVKGGPAPRETGLGAAFLIMH